MTVTLYHGLPDSLRTQAAALYWEAFGGKLPGGTMVTTKCFVGNMAAAEVPMGEVMADSLWGQMAPSFLSATNVRT